MIRDYVILTEDDLKQSVKILRSIVLDEECLLPYRVKWHTILKEKGNPDNMPELVRLMISVDVAYNKKYKEHVFLIQSDDDDMIFVIEK